MKKNFERAVSVVLLVEGGTTDDAGGFTSMGISTRFAVTIGLSRVDVAAMTSERATSIYREHFWAPLRCDDLPAGVDLMAMDTCVQHGQGDAARILQQALRVVVDLDVGPITIAMANARDPSTTADEMAARRMVKYGHELGWDLNDLGWSRRLMRVHAECLRMAGKPS